MGAPAISARGFVAASVLCVEVTACGRLGYDLLAPGDGSSSGGMTGAGGQRGTTDSGASDDGDASPTGGGGVIATGGNPSGGAPPQGGTSGAGGSIGSGGMKLDAGTRDATAPIDGAPADGSIASCGTATGALQTWTFDSQTSGWAWSPDVGAGSLSWTSSIGNPAAGALALDVTSGTGRLGWVLYLFSPTDLRGHVAHAWVRLESGSDVGVKLFVQVDTPGYDWADGGFVPLAPGVWTCLTLDLDAPSYGSAGFDASKVNRFGIEFGGTAPLAVSVDQLLY